MHKLKVRFMLIVCQFIGDWYMSQSVDDEGRSKRLKSITDLAKDLKDEQETV